MSNEEVKKIAEGTLNWINCIDGLDRRKRCRDAIEHGIREALEAESPAQELIESGVKIHYEIVPLSWNGEEGMSSSIYEFNFTQQQLKNGFLEAVLTYAKVQNPVIKYRIYECRTVRKALSTTKQPEGGV